ncbi:MAG: HNH endonuclease, partial [Acidimicrobiia bacterium]|nr:HNH endonuclease [Acidimicrobiia bacterium]
MDPFARGGGTDLDNLIPLCWGCHAKIHDHDWQVVGAGDGKHTIRPPDRIHHGAAHMPDTAPLFAPTQPPDNAERDRRAPSGSGGSSIGVSGNGNRAGPAGPQAARAALRRVRAARRDAQAEPGVVHG